MEKEYFHWRRLEESSRNWKAKKAQAKASYTFVSPVSDGQERGDERKEERRRREGDHPACFPTGRIAFLPSLFLVEIGDLQVFRTDCTAVQSG